MDQPSDSDDYELMPRKEIDKLRKEISGMKKNPYGVSDKGQDLQVSIERLNATMNKLIAILEDAQQDIIDEYQESKPVEKLNQILDQNETIARALVAINNNLKGSSGSTPSTSQQSMPDGAQYPDFSMPKDKPQSPLQQNQQYQPPQQFQQQTPQPTQQTIPMQQNMQNRPQFNQQAPRPQFNMSPAQPMQQSPMPSMNAPPQFPQQFQQPQQYQQQFGNIPPLDGLSLDNIPPLDTPPDAGMLPEKKKKFLGLI